MSLKSLALMADYERRTQDLRAREQRLAAHALRLFTLSGCDGDFFKADSTTQRPFYEMGEQIAISEGY